LPNDSDLEASESLLGSNVNRHATYGVTDSKPMPLRQHSMKQKGGWLDYFIGFRILFPYIWYL
jgi:ATP-binding cassette, subfamily B, vacuolar membrane transporter HMT1/ACLQ